MEQFNYTLHFRHTYMHIIFYSSLLRHFVIKHICECGQHYVELSLQFVLYLYSCTVELQAPFGLYPLPGPDGLATEEAIQLLHAPTQDVIVLPRIPKGTKDNVYCLVDISKSLKCRHFGYSRIFDDDCGPWQSSKSSCVTSPYVVDGQNGLKRIFWIASQQAYCSEVKVDGKRVYTPLDPQPSPDTVIKLKRYYVKLAANDEYRRRITTLIESNVTAEHSVAIVEYFGERVLDVSYSGCEKDDGDTQTVVCDKKVNDSNSQENGTKEHKCESPAEFQSDMPVLLDSGLMSHTELPHKQESLCLLDIDDHCSEVKRFFLLSACGNLLTL